MLCSINIILKLFVLTFTYLLKNISGNYGNVLGLYWQTNFIYNYMIVQTITAHGKST